MAKQRSEIVLAALAAGNPTERFLFDPVRVQKLFFLIDREIPQYIDGPYFHFEPYHYGPFDKAVYEELDRLAMQQEINIDTTKRYSRYSLTDAGHARGATVLGSLPKLASGYMKDAAKWVCSVSFNHLLSAIYQHYPDMATNSVIPHLTPSDSFASHQSSMSAFLSGMARTLDFMGTLDDHPSDPSSKRRDALAVYRDWSAVGDDLRAAMARGTQ